MDTQLQNLNHTSKFGVGHLLAIISVFGIGLVAMIALLGPQPDESMLGEIDKAIVGELRQAGLNIRDEFS